MIHEKLHAYIKEKGIKQSAIAKHLGVTCGLVSQMLLGKVKMSAENFFAICDFIGADPAQFKPDEH